MKHKLSFLPLYFLNLIKTMLEFITCCFEHVGWTNFDIGYVPLIDGSHISLLDPLCSQFGMSLSLCILMRTMWKMLFYSFLVKWGL